MSIMIRTVQSVTMSGTDATAAAAMAWPYDNTGVLQSARILSNTTVAADNTDNITITATQNSIAIFTRVTNVASGALAAGDSELQTFGATMVGDKLELEKGEEVTFAVTKGGTGPAYELSIELIYKLVN